VKINRWMGVELAPEKIGQFLDDNWPAFAAFAWDRFQADGRGIVRFDLATATQELTGQRGYSLNVDYMTDKVVREMGARPPSAEIEKMVSDVKRMLSEYDPEAEMLSVFIMPNNITVRRDHANERLTPRQAYEAGHTPKTFRLPGNN
jgi:hypothetical protein